MFIMKQILYIISIALMAAIAFISCKGTSKTNPTGPGIPNFIGTWYYETMTQTVLGTACFTTTSTTRKNSNSTKSILRTA